MIRSVRYILVDQSGAKLRAVAWRAGESEMGQRLLAGHGALHVAGRLKPDDGSGATAWKWRSKTPPIRVGSIFD